MVNILFWNVNCRPLEDLLAAAVKLHDLDLLILAENTMPTSSVLQMLNQARPGYNTRPWSICSKITVFTRFHVSFLEPTEESDRVLICRLKLPVRPEVLIAMVHLPSKIHANDADQLAHCQLLAEAIRSAEGKAGHTRTVLVGDLNVNPFEVAVVGAHGLHAVMSKQVALKNSRKILEKNYRFFYNPMWRHFGEHSSSPPGTYYYGSSSYVTYFWNIFDQVLIRPDLIPYFHDQDLKILTSIGPAKLTGTNGLPDKKAGSDHLPIIFKLSI